jgi:uncharacterized protein (TIGR02145 family)
VQLIDFVGGWSTAGRKLKSTTGWNNNGDGSTDQYGFSALPSGCGYSDGDFDYASCYGYWWSASEYYDIPDKAYYAWYLSMFANYGDASWPNTANGLYKDSPFSVRCVQD